MWSLFLCKHLVFEQNCPEYHQRMIKYSPIFVSMGFNQNGLTAELGDEKSTRTDRGSSVSMKNILRSVPQSMFKTFDTNHGVNVSVLCIIICFNNHVIVLQRTKVDSSQLDNNHQTMFFKTLRLQKNFPTIINKLKDPKTW